MVHVAYKNAIQAYFKGVVGLNPLRLSTAYVKQLLKNWIQSYSYMSVSFAETYFGNRCRREKSLLGFDRACVGVHEQRVNIKMAIIMTDVGHYNFMLNCNVDCKKQSLMQNMHL